MSDETHFGVKVIMKRPSFWDWLLGSEAVAEFVFVYELDGPTKVVSMKGAKAVLVEGPFDRV